MTRDQKAMAAYGSVVVVGIFLLLAWSRIGGFLLLVLGLAAVTAVLRLTHPRGSVLRDRLGLPPRTAAPPSASQEEQRRLRMELQRRRDEATARTLGAEERRSPPEDRW